MMARRFAMAVLVAATGCRGLLGLDDSVPRDGSGDDDAPNLIDAPLCWGSEPRVCLLVEPTTQVELAGNYTTDPSDTTHAQAPCVDHTPATPDVCVIAGTKIDVTADTSFTGPRPIVMIAVGSISIAHTLDVGSHLQTLTLTQGAGGIIDPAQCPTFAGTPSSHGGGAGGSLGGSGGAGGKNTEGKGGSPAVVELPAQLQGGCPGQSGGSADAMWGRGGYGGGAIELVAGTSIDVSAKLDASGAGGIGGFCTGPCEPDKDTTKANGGGGGGAGGMIVVDAPAVNVMALGAMFADGGGGGEGASHGQNGFDGADPGGDIAAPGANNPTNNSAGKGGPGSHADVLVGGDGTEGIERSTQVGPGGGGGGGGGPGVIHARGTQAIAGGGIISPPASFP